MVSSELEAKFRAGDVQVGEWGKKKPEPDPESKPKAGVGEDGGVIIVAGTIARPRERAAYRGERDIARKKGGEMERRRRRCRWNCSRGG